MNKKHKIEMSNLFSDETNLLPSVRKYSDGFMEWLKSEGHKVSFSYDADTIIDGRSITIDNRAKKTYNLLRRQYLTFLEKEVSKND